METKDFTANSIFENTSEIMFMLKKNEFSKKYRELKAIPEISGELDSVKKAVRKNISIWHDFAPSIDGCNRCYLKVLGLPFSMKPLPCEALKSSKRFNSCSEYYFFLDWLLGIPEGTVMKNE